MFSNEEPSDQMLANLALLYQEDPDLFEEQRQQLIRQTIEEFPEEYRQRAYGIQFRLEAQLRRYKDPVARMNKMVEIFWQNFYEFAEVLNSPSAALKKRQDRKSEGTVLHFPEDRNPSLQ
jgi:hypothetical protein